MQTFQFTNEKGKTKAPNERGWNDPKQNQKKSLQKIPSEEVFE